MNPFSYIVLIYYFFVCAVFHNRGTKSIFLKLMVFAIFVSIHVGRGFFLRVSDDVYLYFNEAVSLLLLPFSFVIMVWHLFSDSRNKILWMRWLTFVLAVLASLTLLAVHPEKAGVAINEEKVSLFIFGGNPRLRAAQFTPNSLLEVIFILCAAVNMGAAFLCLRDKDWMSLLKGTSILCKGAVAIGFFELISKDVFHAEIFENAVNGFFGVGSSTYSHLNLRDSLYMLEGFTREASHYSYSLMITSLVFFAEMKALGRNNRAWMVLTVIEAFLSTAMSAFLYFGFFALLFLLYKLHLVPTARERRAYLIVGGVILLVLGNEVASIVVANFNGQNSLLGRLGTLLNGLGTLLSGEALAPDGSSSMRMYTVITTLNILRYRPLFGIGPATNFCHGSAANLLAQYGLVGTFSAMLFQFFPYGKEKKFGRYYFYAFGIWFFSMFMTSRGMYFVTSVENLILFACFRALYTNTLVSQAHMDAP